MLSLLDLRCPEYRGEQLLLGNGPGNNIISSSKLKRSNRFWKKNCPRPCDDFGVVRFSMVLLGEPHTAVQD